MLFPPQPTTTPEDQRTLERAYHREALHDLVRLGINTAKALERRAVDSAIDGTNTVIEAAIAFERVARAIRRTILLAEKLAEPPTHEASENPKTDPAPATPNHDRPEPYADRPEHPHEDHADPIDDPSEDAREDAREDTREDPAADAPHNDAPTQRPIPEQIAAIRRDLTQNMPVRPLEGPDPPNLPLPQRYPRHDWVGPPAKKRQPAKSPPIKPKPHTRKRKA